jgi:hypothetical protein
MKRAMESEPPSRDRTQVFMVGQDSHGNWVVRDHSGLRGGLFVGRAEALRYINDEARNHPRAIVMVSGNLELDTSGARRPSILHHLSAEEGRVRRVA